MGAVSPLIFQQASSYPAPLSAAGSDGEAAGLPVRATMAYSNRQADEWVARRLLSQKAASAYLTEGQVPSDECWLAPREPLAMQGRTHAVDGAARALACELEATDAPAVVGFDSEDTPQFLRLSPDDGPALVQLAVEDDVLLCPVRRGRAPPRLVTAALETPVLLKAGVGVLRDTDTMVEDHGVHCKSLLDISLAHTVLVVSGLLGPEHDLGQITSPEHWLQLPAEMRCGDGLPMGGLQQLQQQPRQEQAPPAEDGVLRSVLELPHVAETVARRSTMLRVNSIGLARLAEHWCGVKSWKSRISRSNWGRLPLASDQIVYAAVDAWAGSAIVAGMFKAGAIDHALATAIATEA